MVNVFSIFIYFFVFGCVWYLVSKLLIYLFLKDESTSVESMEPPQMPMKMLIKTPAKTKKVCFCFTYKNIVILSLKAYDAVG